MNARRKVLRRTPTISSTGRSAGGLNPDLRPGDVVIGAKTAYHDYGEWTPEGFRVGRTVDPFTGKPNPLFFPADAGLLAVAEKAALDLKLAPVKMASGERTPRVVTGVIVTGDAFVASAAKKVQISDAMRMKCSSRLFRPRWIDAGGSLVAVISWQRLARSRSRCFSICSTTTCA